MYFRKLASIRFFKRLKYFESINQVCSNFLRLDLFGFFKIKPRTIFIADSFSSNTKMTDLITKINSNYEVLLEKIRSIETMVQSQQNLKNSRTNGSVDNKVSNNENTENERQRLECENRSLRLEVDKLTKKLTELEIQIKGQENVVSVELLNKIKQVKGPELTCSEPTKPSSEIVQKKPKQDNQAQKSNKKNDPQQKLTEKKEVKASPAPNAGEKSKTPVNKKSNEPAAVESIDASRLDLRVGRIVDVRKHPDADSLYIEQIDCGEEKPRTVVSGLVKFVPIEEMSNRMVVILCNLKPAKMRGIVSEAMVMCASTPEKVEILKPPEGAQPGDRVMFEKYPGQPDTQLNPKKKIWEQIAPDLSTNNQFEATYKGDPFVVLGKGTIKSETLKQVPVK